MNTLTVKVNILEQSKTANSSVNNTFVKPPSFDEIGIDHNTGVKLERLINKKQRFNNIANILSTHVSESTTPSAYFFCYFPRPLFWDDADYVELHNARIKSIQTAWLSEDIKFIQKSIDDIEAAIDEIKQENSSSNPNLNMNEVVRKINDQVELHLTRYVNASSEKLGRKPEMKYYTVKTHKYGSQNNVNESQNQTSDSASNHRPSKRQRSKSLQRNNQSVNSQQPQHQNRRSSMRRPSQAGQNKQYNPHGSAFSMNSPRVNFSQSNGHDLFN